MDLVETLRSMDRATLSLLFYGTAVTVIAAYSLFLAFDWQRRFNAVRKYADEVVAQNDEFQKALEERRRWGGEEGGEIVEVPEDQQGPGPGETIH